MKFDNNKQLIIEATDACWNCIKSWHCKSQLGLMDQLFSVVKLQEDARICVDSCSSKLNIIKE